MDTKSHKIAGVGVLVALAMVLFGIIDTYIIRYSRN